jgi:hypothetical protein
MASGAGLTRLRYQWMAGTGGWADLRQRWASLPGRSFDHQIAMAPDRRLSLAYQGFPEGLVYITPYLREQLAALAGAPDIAAAAPLTWSGIRNGAASPDADILLVGCTRRRAFALPRERSVVLPFRVHLLLDVIDDVARMHKCVSPNERRQFAKLRSRHDWTAEIATDVESLTYFYERMHLPTMASRHREEARSTDWDIALRCLFRKGFLLYVRQGDERVAGVLCRLEDGGRTLRMRLLGVLDGDEEHYRGGAVKAVYYLTMEWAAQHGVTRIDFSGADPFPGKGVFQFKRRFHPTVAHPVDHFADRRVYLRVAKDTPAVRDFLVATPMLTVDEDDRLIATHFRDEQRPARLEVRAGGPGVADERVIDLDEFLGATMDAAHTRAA